MDDTTKQLEQYKAYVKEKIDAILPIFAKASIGDFSSNVTIPGEEDEFSQLYVGLQLVLEVIREKIEELKKANTELATRTSKTELEKLQDEAILNNIGEGLVVTDQEGKVLVFNKTAENLMGVLSRDVEGKEFIPLFPMDDENGHEIIDEDRPMTQTLMTGKKTSGLYVYHRPDNSKFPVGITVTPLLFNGQIVGTIEVFRDVTAEKELERMKDEFVSMSSHELRTPMTAIKGFMSMIFRGDFGPVNEGLKTPLQTIANSTERLITLVNNLLDVSRIESRRVTYEITDFAITDLIAEVCQTLYPLTQQKGITLSAPKHEDILVQADPDKVKQILHNIIGNALKFTEHGGIDIQVVEEGEEAKVFIKDSGMGIAQENQGNLFKKFEQVRTQQAGRPVGSGLGLYISAQLAEKMGGKLWLEHSEPQVGSMFALSLPLSGTKIAQDVRENLTKEGVLTDLLVGGID